MPAPTVAVAIDETLRRKLFNGTDWERLSQMASVRILESPGDLACPTAATALEDATVLVTGWGSGRLDESVLTHAPHLKALVHTGGSVRSVAAPEVYKHSVVVSSQTEANSQPVAEFTVAMILLAGKDVWRSARLYRERKSFIDRELLFPNAGLYQRRVAIIGLSRISRRVIYLLKSYDLDVVVFSRHLDDKQAARLGVRSVTLEEALATGDVVSLHSASLPSTYHMIGAKELALLKDGSTLINTARGALIDQDALIAELVTGRFDAILDVADPDVTEPHSPLWDLPNVLLTPHFAGAVGNELQRLGRAAVDDVEAILEGRSPQGLVTESQYEAQA